MQKDEEKKAFPLPDIYTFKPRLKLQKDGNEKPWCTCGVIYYSYGLHPSPYPPDTITINIICLSCGKMYKRWYQDEEFESRIQM